MPNSAIAMITMAMTRKIPNSTLAIVAAPAATPENPSPPAITATTAAIIPHHNKSMALSLIRGGKTIKACRPRPHGQTGDTPRVETLFLAGEGLFYVVDGLVNLFLDFAGRLIGFPFAAQLVVDGESSSGFFHASFDFVRFASHEISLLF